MYIGTSGYNLGSKVFVSFGRVGFIQISIIFSDNRYSHPIINLRSKRLF